MMSRVRRMAAIAAFALCLVAGCTGSDGTDVPTTPPNSASSTPTTPTPSRTGPLTTGPGVQPGEKPPVLSAEARKHTPTGALLFAQYYFLAFDWGYATTDPYLVSKISAPGCSACTRYVNALRDLRRRGGYVTRGRVTVRSGRLVIGEFKIDSDFVVRVVVDEQPVVVNMPSSSPSTAAPALKQDPSLVFVSWLQNGWKVVGVGTPS